MFRVVTNLRVVGLAVVVVAASLAGCSEKGGQHKVRKVEGRAHTIDLEHNVVSMMVTNEKGQEQELAGTVREDTKVLINGREHALADVKPGDKVTVYGYREKEGDQGLVATRVEVKRDSDSEWEPVKTSGNNDTGTKASAPEPSVTAPVKTAVATGSNDISSSIPPANGDSDAPVLDARTHAEDMIYTRIRMSMEDALEERSDLLKAGVDPTDTKVRELEGRIMKARELLMEVNEIVEDVEPPIVQ